MKESFWEKVEKCKHINLYPDYYQGFSCETEYCSAFEIHCSDCGVFITECDCGYCNGMSGWPESRWRKRRRKVNQKGSGAVSKTDGSY